MTTNKKYYIELIRIYAVFCVIFIQTNYTGYALFTNEPVGSLRYWVFMILSIVSKAAVPLFFMISGAVLLHKKDESLSKIWKVRMPRIVLCLVVFSLFYYVCGTRTGRFPGTPLNFLKAFYEGSIQTHLWYLYAYISILILLPFTRTPIQNLKQEYFYYLFVLVLISGPVISFIQFFSGNKISIEPHANFPVLRTNYLFYPVVGYFFEHRASNEERKKSIYVLFFLTLVLIALTCVSTYYIQKTTGNTDIQTLEKYFGMPAYTLAPLLFLLFKSLEEQKCPLRVQQLALLLGSCTMGVYLIHIYFMRYTILERVPAVLVEWGCPKLLSAYLFCLLIFVICSFITYIWKKIPYLKYLIGG